MINNKKKPKDFRWLLTCLCSFFGVISLMLINMAAACVGDPLPVDEEEADPSINKAIVKDVDDDDDSGSSQKVKLSFPRFDDGSGDLLAFPGAEGHGRYTRGARAAESYSVYRVTNLNTSGEGSFKDAISQPNRIIVFAVSGVINLNKEAYSFKNNQTVLFETAPGDGIELYNGRMMGSGATNLIVRYMRQRMGRQFSGADSGDAAGVANGSDQIYDHCSITWGLDENFSISADNKGTRPKNITIQNSIIGQGCMNHSCGGLVQTNDDEGITIFRNLLIDNLTRNFKVKGLNQYVNNVIYNWKDGAYIMGGDSDGHSDTDIENNYFIKGPCYIWRNTAVANVDPNIIGDLTKCIPSGSDGSYYMVLEKSNPCAPFTRGNENFDTYCVGNYYDDNVDGKLNGVEITQANWSTYMDFTPSFINSPSALHPNILQKSTAEEAYNYIINNVGAVLPNRDKVDQFMIDELKSLGKEGVILRDQNNETQYPLAKTWQQITIADPAKDTDKDGMPDEFEDMWQLDKNDPSDALKVAGNGYTNIENYAFSLQFPELYESAYTKWKNQ